MIDIKTTASSIWSRFGKYVIIGVLALIVIIASVWIGRWVARGDAERLTQELHSKFMLENKALFDNIAVNQYLIDELKKKASIHAAEIAKLKKDREGGVVNVIKSGDKKKIANMYDNLIDNYTVPSDFGK